MEVILLSVSYIMPLPLPLVLLPLLLLLMVLLLHCFCEILGVRADPVGTPWGVSALIVGGARIRADMRLRSKQQRRVMNAEFSNGICLA